MGITAGYASFAGDRPQLESIVAAIERASGLALIVEARQPDSMFLFRASVAFASVPRERVDVSAYVPGAPSVRDTILATPGIDGLARENPQVARMVAQLKSAPPVDPGLTHVHTRGYVGEEGTLHDHILLALESLGGELGSPMSGERRARNRHPLTAKMLKARHRQHRREWMAELLKAPARILILCSLALCLLLVTFRRFAIEHERIGAGVLFGGYACLVAAFACGLLARGKTRLYVVLGSLLLLLPWILVAGLLAKAAMD